MSLRDRVALLAGSYLEACEADIGETARRGTLGYREPQRGHLWREGSYWELERAVDDLRRHSVWGYRWFWRVYVVKTHPLKGLPVHKRHHAEQALSLVTELVRRAADGNVYVPTEVVLRSEFAAYAGSVKKPRRFFAAAA